MIVDGAGAADGAGSLDPTDTGRSLWTVAELAAIWKGTARFEPLDDGRSRLVVSLPLAVGLPTEFRA